MLCVFPRLSAIFPMLLFVLSRRRSYIAVLSFNYLLPRFLSCMPRLAHVKIRPLSYSPFFSDKMSGAVA